MVGGIFFVVEIFFERPSRIEGLHVQRVFEAEFGNGSAARSKNSKGPPRSKLSKNPKCSKFVVLGISAWNCLKYKKRVRSNGYSNLSSIYSWTGKDERSKTPLLSPLATCVYHLSVAWTMSLQQIYNTKSTIFEQISPETSDICDRFPPCWWANVVRWWWTFLYAPHPL